MRTLIQSVWVAIHSVAKSVVNLTEYGYGIGAVGQIRIACYYEMGYADENVDSSSADDSFCEHHWG